MSLLVKTMYFFLHVYTIFKRIRNMKWNNTKNNQQTQPKSLCQKTIKIKRCRIVSLSRGSCFLPKSWCSRHADMLPSYVH